MKIYALGIAAAAITIAGSAQAAQELKTTTTQSGGMGYAPNSSTPYIATPFDTSLGELTSVNIEYTMLVQSIGTISNKSQTGAMMTMKAVSTSKLLAGDFFVTSQPQTCTKSIAVPGGTSYQTGCTSKNTYSIVADKDTNASLFSKFIQGNSPVRFTSEASSTIEGARYDEVSVNSTIRLSYTYIPAAITSAVPEPATWAMMAGGFAMVAAAARRRRRTFVAA